MMVTIRAKPFLASLRMAEHACHIFCPNMDENFTTRIQPTPRVSILYRYAFDIH
jgi:hypothetical protein